MNELYLNFLYLFSPLFAGHGPAKSGLNRYNFLASWADSWWERRIFRCR